MLSPNKMHLCIRHRAWAMLDIYLPGKQPARYVGTTCISNASRTARLRLRDFSTDRHVAHPIPEAATPPSRQAVYLAKKRNGSHRRMQRDIERSSGQSNEENRFYGDLREPGTGVALAEAIKKLGARSRIRRGRMCFAKSWEASRRRQERSISSGIGSYAFIDLSSAKSKLGYLRRTIILSLDTAIRVTFNNTRGLTAGQRFYEPILSLLPRALSQSIENVLLEMAAEMEPLGLIKSAKIVTTTLYAPLKL
ncbi:hypothetical protein WN48_02935 [Eufriesea mexicana]|nr:hypothetical protein WN48_02935 [Eufriesea mexicana]